MEELLEALASVRSPNDSCQFCNAREDTPVQSVSLNTHDESCPRRRAALVLAQQGTPLKIWRISYQTQRETRINNTEQLVMRCELSEEDALALIPHLLSASRRKRQLVEGSMHIEELGIVPCE
jgi:hypothetical protein